MIETPWWLPGHAAKSGDKDVILLYFQCRHINYLGKSDEYVFLSKTSEP